MKLLSLAITIALTSLLSSCADYEKFRQVTEDIEVPSRVYWAAQDLVWSAVLDVMNQYDTSAVNQEAGFIKTAWIDNTLDANFSDSFGGKDKVKASKYKLIVNVVKGYRLDKEVTKVTIYKRQLIEQDFLQGWKEVATDGILEKTILYRIDRKIKIDLELNKIQKQKEKELIQNF